MTIRENLVKCLEGGGTPDEVARRICGMLSCECSLDNGNGWYDDDPDMADDGLNQAEGEWLAAVGPEREKATEAALEELAARWAWEDAAKGP